MKQKLLILFVLCSLSLNLKAELPEKIVVLTFDDAVISQYNFVAPILKDYNFGATFFVCEFPAKSDSEKVQYMNWEQIKDLADLGFEIANHTKNHVNVTKVSADSLVTELAYIDKQCNKYGIEKPMTFAYPGYGNNLQTQELLKQQGFWYARAGGGRPYNIENDNPFLLPSYDIAGTDTVKVYKALRSASKGNVVILTIHGVPDIIHPWVNTPPELFKEYMNFLKRNNYTVWSLKQLHENLYSN